MKGFTAIALSEVEICCYVLKRIRKGAAMNNKRSANLNVFILFTLMLCLSTVELQAETFRLNSWEYTTVNGKWYNIVDGDLGDEISLYTIVVRKADRGSISEIDLSENNVRNVRVASRRIATGFYLLKIDPSEDPFEVASKLNNTGLFDEIYFSGIGRPASTPADEYFPDQWNLMESKLNMERAWDITTGDSTIIVAIIDTGVDYQQLDINANIWHNECEIAGNHVDDDDNDYVDDTKGWDFFGDDLDTLCCDPDEDPYDPYGHGTLVAGIISAETNYYDYDVWRGIAGIAGGWGGTTGYKRGCLYMPLRVGNHKIYDAVLAEAIEYARNNGASIINISIEFMKSYPAIKDAIDIAVYNSNCVVVAAAGNCYGERECPLKYPARYNNVISVGATDINDVRHELYQVPGFYQYSSAIGNAVQGYILDVMAPSDVYTTANWFSIMFPYGPYWEHFHMTSASAPHVTGQAALIRSIAPDLDWNDVRDIIRNTSDKVSGMSGSSYTDYYGYGRIDIFQSLMKVKYDAQVVACNIQDNTTWPPNAYYKNVYVSSDVTIAPGKTLTINPGTTVFIDDVDHQDNGVDSTRIEFNVEGYLEANGTSISPIVFQVWPEVSPSKSDWVGMYFDNSSSGGNLNYCTIKHAEYAIETYAPLTLNYCTIDSTDVCGIAIESSTTSIKNSFVSNSDVFGAFLGASTLVIDSCTFDDNFSAGVELNGYDTLLAYGNTFTNNDKGLILNYDAVAYVDSCFFEYNDIGISLSHNSSAGIRKSTLENNTTDGIYCNHYTLTYIGDNVISNNDAGIYCYDNSNPLIEDNTITYNYTGVYATDGSDPDIGHAGVSGNNSIHSSTGAHVANTSSSITVKAESNWWGSNQGPRRTKIVGYVDYNPWLSSPPAVSAWDFAENDATTEKSLPSTYSISRIVPNPFNPSTTIYFQVPPPGDIVRIAIYNVAGQIIKVLLNDYQDPGYHEITWNGFDEKDEHVSSSVYFARMSANEFRETKKMVLLK